MRCERDTRGARAGRRDAPPRRRAPRVQRWPYGALAVALSPVAEMMNVPAAVLAANA